VILLYWRVALAALVCETGRRDGRLGEKGVGVLKPVGGVTFALLSSILASSSLAQIIPVSQQRWVSASSAIFIPGDSASDSRFEAAPDFGPFSASPSPINLALGSSMANAEVNQSSQISSTVTMNGLASADATSGASGETSQSEAHTLVSLTFDLGQDNFWRLSGSALCEFAGGGSADALIQLTRGTSVLAGLSGVCNTGTSDELDTILLLTAGQYTLAAQANANANATFESAGYGVSAIDFTLEKVPEPASGAFISLLSVYLLGRCPLSIRNRLRSSQVSS
jgi:hypothetical protein